MHCATGCQSLARNRADLSGGNYRRLIATSINMGLTWRFCPVVVLSFLANRQSTIAWIAGPRRGVDVLGMGALMGERPFLANTRFLIIPIRVPVIILSGITKMFLSNTRFFGDTVFW